MLSLPIFAPQPDANFWPSHRPSTNYFDNGASEAHTSHLHNANRRPTSQHGHQNGQNLSSSRSLLAALAADENAILQRKQNIRNFGAGWLRPPGQPKTLQTLKDEAAEREEQDTLARREQVLRDLAAAQTDAANRETAAEGHDEEMMEGERDLDNDIPEAVEDPSEVSLTETNSDPEDGDTSAITGQGDMTFNEDSFIEGSVLEAEVEQMLEEEVAEMAGVRQDERDLDDDIPEAGDYEHTDTELDYSSDVDTSLLTDPSTGRRLSAVRETRRRRSGRRSSGLPSVTTDRRGSGGLQAAPVTRNTLFNGLNLDATIGGRISNINTDSTRGGRVSSYHLGSNRSSFGLDGSSSLLDGSSFLHTSPVVARGSLQSRFMGARAQRDG